MARGGQGLQPEGVAPADTGGGPERVVLMGRKGAKKARVQWWETQPLNFLIHVSRLVAPDSKS